MKLHRYRLNKEQVIEKSLVDVTDDYNFKNYYVILSTTPHPYVKKTAVDVLNNNITAALYFTEEDDQKAVEHFRNLLTKRVEKTYAEYTSAKKKLDTYNECVVIKKIIL